MLQGKGEWVVDQLGLCSQLYQCMRAVAVDMRPSELWCLWADMLASPTWHMLDMLVGM